MLREAAAAAEDARTAGRDQLDPALLAALHTRYDRAVDWGITTNRHRDWPRGHHPGYNLARRLRDKADQVWLFTRNLAVPWTNNASEPGPTGPETPPSRLRLLAHPDHPRRGLPRALLPHQRPRPRRPPHRRHPRRPHRQPLAAHPRHSVTSGARPVNGHRRTWPTAWPGQAACYRSASCPLACLGMAFHP